MASEDKELEKTIAEDLVVTKYKLAGEIVNSKHFICWTYLTGDEVDVLEWMTFSRPSRHSNWICGHRNIQCQRSRSKVANYQSSSVFDVDDFIGSQAGWIAGIEYKLRCLH